jgi:ribonuclease P protein component
MLHKRHRLSKITDVRKALGRGRGFFSPNFNIKFLPNFLYKRFTVVVSLKVSKKATRRNRIKRLLRECIRKHIKNFSFGDYVIIVKPVAGKQDDQILISSFQEFLVKTKLVKK